MQRNYLQEINDGRIDLYDIPANECTEEIYLAAVQKIGANLMYIPEDKRTARICLAAVQKNWEVLRFVRQDKRTDELCLAAVQQDGMALKLLIKENRSDEIYLAAVQQNSLALEYISKERRSDKLCLLSVEKNGMALEFVPENMKTPDICLLAMQKDVMALQHIPIDKLTPEIFMLKIMRSWSSLQYVPVNMRTPELCLAAVQQNVLALQYVPKYICTLEMCLMAVQQNELALQYVPVTYLSRVIDKITISEIIGNNYMSLQSIYDLSGYKEQIDSCLANVEYVIISRVQADDEIRDIRLTYAHQRKHKGKTLCLLSANEITLNTDLEALLLRLKEVNNTNSLHLVFAGHTSEKAISIASMNYTDIISFCKNNRQIEHIELLGCNVAKASKPEEEKKMILQFTENMSIKKDLRYGFLSTLAAAVNGDDFHNKCEVFCKKYHLDGVYALNKTDNGTYQICNYKISNNILNTHDIPENRIGDFNKILENQNKPVPFPKQQGKELTIRGDNKNPLTAKELKSLHALKYEEKRFEKGHPKYKKDRKTYPFLAKVNASVEDLHPSLLQLIATAIEKDKDITWDVTIQGPTKALHVDTARRDFKVTRTHLYPESYKTSLFASKKGNINYDKLNEERKNEIEDMKNSEVKGESKAKKIKVTVSGKK